MTRRLLYQKNGGQTTESAKETRQQSSANDTYIYKCWYTHKYTHIHRFTAVRTREDYKRYYCYIYIHKKHIFLKCALSCVRVDWLLESFCAIRWLVYVRHKKKMPIGICWKVRTSAPKIRGMWAAIRCLRGRAYDTSTFNIPRAQHTRTPATHNTKLVDVPRGVGRQ